MAKEEAISIRVSKEVKDRLQGEAQEAGISLSQHIESYLAIDSGEAKSAVDALIEDAHKKNPAFWAEAVEVKMIRDVELLIPKFVHEFLNPGRQTCESLPNKLSHDVADLFHAIYSNFDSLENTSHKNGVFNVFLMIASNIANKINQFNIIEGDFRQQELNIKTIGDLVERYAYQFSSMAFDKESFKSIKSALDSIENQLLDTLQEDK